MTCYTKEGLLKRHQNNLKLFKAKAEARFGKRYLYDLVTIGINNRKKIPIICRNHGIFYQINSEHLRGANCRHCAKITKDRKLKNGKKLLKGRDKFIIDAKSIHGERYGYEKVEYIKSTIKVIIICSQHGEFKTTPDSHLNMKSGCPSCKSSYGERMIELYLKEMNIIYIKEYSIKNLIGENNRRLRFDFYLPTYKIAIEYDGEQHFLPIVKFGGLKGFNTMKNHEKIKEIYCMENKIKLFKIPFTQKKNIRQVLIDFFNGIKIGID